MHGGAQPVSQSATGNLKYAVQHRIGAGRIFCADLHPPSSRKRAGDRGEPVGGTGSVGVEGQVVRSTDSKASAGGVGSAAARDR